MDFIKKIFSGTPDEKVHSKFTRFGKGIFEKRACMKIRSGKNVKINATSEYANDLVEFFFTLSDKMKADGKIMMRENFDLNTIGINAVKTERKGGLYYEVVIDHELTKKQIDTLADKAYFFLLNLSFEEGELKTKTKLPSSKSTKADYKFCVAMLDTKFSEKVMKEFLFDTIKCKKAEIEHSIEIKDIILPTKIDDYAQARLDAKRKGRLVRKSIIDGKESSKETDFVV